MVLDATQLLHMSLRMHWSKQTRWMLRRTLGMVVATEEKFKAAREKHHATIPKLSLCADNRSVTSQIDETMAWMLELERFKACLLGVHILCTILGNDGTPPPPMVSSTPPPTHTHTQTCTHTHTHTHIYIHTLIFLQ